MVTGGEYGAGYASRPGLTARQPLFGAPSDQVQVSVEPSLDWDDEIEQLRAGVGRLKQVSSAIQEENTLTKQVMDGLESAMETSRQSLKQASKRLRRAMVQSQSNHVLYVFLFAIAVFFALYFWNKLYKLLRWIL
ncbi:SFT1 [Auxenochlorella protothecoides x Auxenochlorella symbiontica]